MMPGSQTRVQPLRRFIDRLLSGTHQHFFEYLPSPTGMLSSLFLKRFFSGIVLTSDQTEMIRRLPKDAIFVYVNKHRSKFDYLFLHTRCRQEKLPVPVLALNCRIRIWQPLSRLIQVFIARADALIHLRVWLNPVECGFFSSELHTGKSAFLSLVGPNGFYHWFVKAGLDPVQHLIKIQKSTDQPIYLIPHLMFFGKNPLPRVPGLVDMFFGTEQKPGRLRRLVKLFRTPGKVFAEFSEPLNLQQFIQAPENIDSSLEQLSLALRRKLLLQLNRHRQSITGPTIKSSEEIKESILTSDRLRGFMEQYAHTRKESIHKVRKEAASDLDEIAARYNHFMIGIYAKIVNWISSTMYDGAVVDRHGLARVKAMALKGPLVLIPCHKSHIDYLILSYVLYQNNMPCPHIAAGKNLSFWPIGPLFRAGGAFFLRRSFRGAVLYSKVFGEYIHKLLEEGFNIVQFIEGGRSRTGKLLMPKLGLLSIMIQAYRNRACEDMIIVPVFIGYDQILEESAYLHELIGGKKEPENLKQVMQARKFLKKRYGKIYINFHEPISMNELLRQSDTQLTGMSTKDQNALIRNLGWRIINAIDRVSVVTPYSLAAAVLLNCPKKRFGREEFMGHMETYLNLLLSQKAKLADTLSFDPTHAVENALDSYIQRKFVERTSEDKKDPTAEALYAVVESKRPILEYYKNNCISYFIPAALTAMAILQKDAFQFSAADLHAHYAFLQDFFKYEFAFNVDLAQEYFVRKTLKFFIDDAILMPHQILPDTYNITSAGYRKLNLYARFLKTYFESYWVVLTFFKRHPKNKLEPKDRLKKIQTLGNRMHKGREIELVESLSKVNYDNAISFFATHQVKGEEDVEQIAHYEQIIQKHLDLLIK
jgi:glycerol-3-phosphate O-acyltransferase